MRSLWKDALFAAGTLAMLAIPWIGIAGAKAPTQVNVVNSPLQIQGSVSVTGGVSINPTPVTVKGTVGLVPNTSVNIANPAGSPVLIRNVDNAATNPFQTQIGISFNDGDSTDNASFMVPGGVELVIQYVSALVDVPTGEKVLCSVETIGGCNDVTHQGFTATLARSPSEGTEELVVGQVTRIYADPGTSVTLACSRGPSSGAITATVSISGYLVNGSAPMCPTPTPVATETPSS